MQDEGLANCRAEFGELECDFTCCVSFDSKQPGDSASRFQGHQMSEHSGGFLGEFSLPCFGQIVSHYFEHDIRAGRY